MEAAAPPACWKAARNPLDSRSFFFVGRAISRQPPSRAALLHMIPPFRAYLFDVDGTLVDSAADICGTIQQVLATTRQDSVAEDFLRPYIGRHLHCLFW